MRGNVKIGHDRSGHSWYLVQEHALTEEGHDERVYAMMRVSHERSC